MIKSILKKPTETMERNLKSDKQDALYHGAIINDRDYLSTKHIFQVYDGLMILIVCKTEESKAREVNICGSERGEKMGIDKSKNLIDYLVTNTHRR
jgi:hypothetical protein